MHLGGCWREWGVMGVEGECVQGRRVKGEGRERMQGYLSVTSRHAQLALTQQLEIFMFDGVRLDKKKRFYLSRF